MIDLCMHQIGHSDRCNEQIWDKWGGCRSLIRGKPHLESTEEAALKTEKCNN